MEVLITVIYLVVLFLAARWWGRTVAIWEIDNKRTNREGLVALFVGMLVISGGLFTIAHYAIEYYK